MAKVYETFAALNEEIKAARSQSKSEARAKCQKGFLRSRGVWLITLSDKKGLVPPYNENYYSGKSPTGSDFDQLIQLVEKEYPEVDTISFTGGWDFAENLCEFSDGGYDPWVGEWTVLAWSRHIRYPLEQLIRLHSAFDSMDELVEETDPNYRPSLATNSGRDFTERAELTLIADIYDARQKSRNDERRAYRY